VAKFFNNREAVKFFFFHKMTLLEKTQKSADEKVFTLYKEGLFYKCYNEDAMVFTEKVKKYKVSARFIKTVGSQVLSLGFPLTVGGKNNLTLKTIALAVEAISFLIGEKSVVFMLKNKEVHD
jgi:TRAP-type mannitol/chloroaromatic compound transport system permease large subunit